MCALLYEMKKYLNIIIVVALSIIITSYSIQLNVVHLDIVPVENEKQLIIYSQIDIKLLKNYSRPTDVPEYYVNQPVIDKYKAQKNKLKDISRELSNSTSLKQNLEIKHDDKDLLDRIHKNLTPPSQKPYNLEDPESDPTAGQARQIRRILGNIKGGFFVECGAWDGEQRSNTLKFEQDLDWNGLLIEADTVNYESLLEKNRKAWSINQCLSLKTHPTTVMFDQNMSSGRIINETRGETSIWQRKVECLPLYSLMLALNVTTIDYFSLDVEGDELPILRTIPWDKLNIRTLSVESFQRTTSKKITKYMNDKGYKLYIQFIHPSGHDKDLIFHKNDIIPKRPALPIKWPVGFQNLECKKREFLLLVNE